MLALPCSAMNYAPTDLDVGSIAEGRAMAREDEPTSTPRAEDLAYRQTFAAMFGHEPRRRP